MLRAEKGDLVSWSISVDVGAPGANLPEAELAGGGSRGQGPI